MQPRRLVPCPSGLLTLLVLAVLVLGVVHLVAGVAGNVQLGGEHVDEVVEVGVVRCEVAVETVVWDADLHGFGIGLRRRGGKHGKRRILESLGHVDGQLEAAGVHLHVGGRVQRCARGPARAAHHARRWRVVGANCSRTSHSRWSKILAPRRTGSR